MARLARAVVPGVPHHVTQRGNRRQDTFFTDEDYEIYKALMAEWCGKFGVEIWAYCLMTNHVHLIAVPPDKTSLSRAIGEAHRRYTRHVNRRKGWTGYLWQGRFASYPMDEDHLLAAAGYVEQNPLRAKMVRQAKAYPWSSARAHLKGTDDDLVKVMPLLSRVDDWANFLAQGIDEDTIKALRGCETTGRPLGNEDFVKDLEVRLGRDLRPGKRGRKPRSD